VADRDVVLADQDLADDEPDDLLALLDGQGLGVCGEAGAEAVEGLGELEVGLGVVCGVSEFVIDRPTFLTQR
jgi:hypothetical protein